MQRFLGPLIRRGMFGKVGSMQSGPRNARKCRDGHRSQQEFRSENSPIPDTAPLLVRRVIRGLCDPTRVALVQGWAPNHSYKPISTSLVLSGYYFRGALDPNTTLKK